MTAGVTDVPDVTDVAEPRVAVPRGPVRFRRSVVLTKGEAFAACQVLADADRCLVRAGQLDEADALGELFELLEARMTAVNRPSDIPNPR